MLQTWIRFTLGIEAVLYVFLALHLHDNGRAPAFIAAVVLLLAFCWRLSHALGSFIVTEGFRLRDGRRAAMIPNIRALVGEFTSRLTSYNWSQAFPQWAMGDDPAGAKAGTPILLVHGYFSNRGMWVRFRGRLTAAGLGPVYTITLEPVLGSIDDMMPALAQRIEDICRDTGKPGVILIAHSMGGLVSRAYMAAHGSTRVEKFITLGSPHHGTATASFGTGLCTQQMRIGSEWLRKLAETESSSAYRKPPTLCLYTINDDIVYPPETAELPWAECVQGDGVGHVGLLFSKDVVGRVIGVVRGGRRFGVSVTRYF